MGRAELSVQVVYSPRAGVVDSVDLSLPAGATVRDAVHASGLAERHQGLDVAAAGVWGKPSSPQALLRDRDRVEFYRALTVDPKEARRRRDGAQRRR